MRVGGNNMKIAYVNLSLEKKALPKKLFCDMVYPWIKGGAEKRIYEIFKRLVERGHEVHLLEAFLIKLFLKVCGIKWWNGNGTIEQNGVYLHGVCEPRDLYVEGGRSIKKALYFAWKLLFPLLKEDFDIVDCQEFPYFPCFSIKSLTNSINNLRREEHGN